ncbi:MAG: single-stranded DNA-binding protein [Deltaproteobacteria bacterium]|nr:MAG: single-stranded DNA-binding protein [Deltaproteobacteria bacterium]
MAGSVNKAIIIGNLGRDPEVRYTSGGQAVCNFTVATNEQWKDKSGQRQERTEWHRVVVWGRQGELCGQYLAKGRTVYVEGRLQTREWTDRDGNKRYTTEIVAQNVQFLDTRGGGGPAEVAGGPDDFGPPPPGFDEGGADDDIPF